MIDLFKDRYKLGLLLATLFFIGIVASLYQIYRLPYNLMLTDSSHPALYNVYIVLGITFLVGGFALWWTINHQNEVIVFRDKQLDNSSTNTKDGSESGQTTISLDPVKDSLKGGNEKEVLRSGLQAICKQLDAGQGAVYMVTEEDGRRKVEFKSGYALSVGESTVLTYEVGEGLIGQTAAGGKTLYLDDVPEGYVKIISGLGSASPRFLLIVPIKQQNKVLGVMEIASFTPVSEDQRKFVEESAQLVADKISGENL